MTGLESLAAGAIGGALAGVALSPLVYAIWRGRKAPMLQVLSSSSWKRSWLAAGAFVVLATLAFGVLSGDNSQEAIDFVVMLIAALCVACGVWALVVRVADRHG